MTPQQVLSTAQTILIIDWPSRDVPDTLARAGYHVVVRGGPTAADVKRYEVQGGEVVPQVLQEPLTNVDLIYVYRPLAELPAIVGEAKRLGAKALWYQSGRTTDGVRDPKACWLPAGEAELVYSIVEGGGLTRVAGEYIADIARATPRQ